MIKNVVEENLIIRNTRCAQFHLIVIHLDNLFLIVTCNKCQKFSLTNYIIRQ